MFTIVFGDVVYTQSSSAWNTYSVVATTAIAAGSLLIAYRTYTANQRNTKNLRRRDDYREKVATPVSLIISKLDELMADTDEWKDEDSKHSAESIRKSGNRITRHISRTIIGLCNQEELCGNWSGIDTENYDEILSELCDTRRELGSNTLKLEASRLALTLQQTLQTNEPDSL